MAKRVIKKRHGPPFYRGILPLIDAGLLEKASDPLGKFLWECEKTYLDKHILQAALVSHGVDVEALLTIQRPSLSTPGSPGHHRKVFDPWYVRIARDVQARKTFRSYEPDSKKKPH